MRSAPILKIWMTPFASVAMLEKFALLRIAFCKAPALSRASWLRTSVAMLVAPLVELGAAGLTNFLDVAASVLRLSAQGQVGHYGL